MKSKFVLLTVIMCMFILMASLVLSTAEPPPDPAPPNVVEGENSLQSFTPEYLFGVPTGVSVVEYYNPVTASIETATGVNMDMNGFNTLINSNPGDTITPGNFMTGQNEGYISFIGSAFGSENIVLTSIQNPDGTWNNFGTNIYGETVDGFPTTGTVEPIWGQEPVPLIVPSSISIGSLDFLNPTSELPSFEFPTFTLTPTTSEVKTAPAPSVSVSPFCGDGVVTGAEQCESSGSCRQLELKCDGARTLTRPAYGSCRNDCVCTYSEFEVQCIQNSCGAGCSTDLDCGSGEVCDAASCQCAAGIVCGNGILQTGEECDFAGEQVVSSTAFCTFKQICVGCQLQGVIDTTQSSFEVCDGIDNDCNGIDDDFVVDTCQNEEAFCPNQLGVCKGSLRTCNGAAGFGECSTEEYDYTGLFETTESRCDGFDNDCDGSVDEGCNCVPGAVQNCGFGIIGVCSEGTQTCSSDGTWQDCFGAVNPQTTSEVSCDGTDNDCDNQIDECITNRCGECGELASEVCNFKDENCNAETQSPTTATFDPIIGQYVDFTDYCLPGQICKGSFADGIDNNEDGVVDEGIDENVKIFPELDYTGWCPLCTTITRECKEYNRSDFDLIHNFKRTSSSSRDQQTSEGKFFACPVDNTDTVCCSDPNSCVFNGVCYPDRHLEDVDGDGIQERCIASSPGEWIDEFELNCTNGIDDDADTFIDVADSDCDGNITGITTDQAGAPVAQTTVTVFNESLGELATVITESDGLFSVKSPFGNLIIIAFHPDFVSVTKNLVLDPRGNLSANFTGDDALAEGTSCITDCTFAGDNIVHASCNGINGCQFFSPEAAVICDNAQPGWIRDFPGDQTIECAEGSPIPKVPTQAKVTCEDDNLVKLTKIVTYKGNPVKFVVVTCG